MKRKPMRAYTMQQLQDIASAPENHPAKLVEACRHEIGIREESRKYRKEVEAYDDVQIEDILSDKAAHPEALVYRCQVEKRRRAKTAHETVPQETAAPTASGILAETAEEKTPEPEAPSVQIPQDTEVRMSWWKRKTAEANAGVSDRSIGYLYTGLLAVFGWPVLTIICSWLFGHGCVTVLDIAGIAICILLVAGKRASLTPAAKTGLLMTIFGPIIGFIGILVFVNNSPVATKIKKGLTVYGVATLVVQLALYIFLFNPTDPQYFGIISTVSFAVAAANFCYLLFVCLTEEKGKIASCWKNRKQQVQ